MNTWIIIGIIALIVLLVIFRKRIKEILIGLGILLFGWGVVETGGEIPVPNDDGLEQPVEVVDTLEVDSIKYVSGDQTRTIREHLGNDSDIYQFPEDTLITHGMLPEDLEKEYGPYGFIGDVGAGKILPIHNKKDFIFLGGNFKNPEYAFEYKNRPTRRHHNVSELSFLDLDNVENAVFQDISFKGPHFDIREKTGYPNFHSAREFAHGIDLRNSQNVLFKGLNFSNVPGDFLYFRKGAGRPNKNISIIDCVIDFNGRQGVAWGDGENIYIDNLTVTESGRGGADFEPPKHGYVAKNVIIKNSYFNTWLLPMPMGGMGTVENVLIENNKWQTGSPDTYIYADRVNSFRRNIIFRGNERLSGYGSDDAVIVAEGVEGFLIEDHYAYLKETRSREIALLNNCTNVVIRNSDFPNGKYIVLRDTPIEEVTVYGNVQDFEFKIYQFDMPFKPAPNLKDFAHFGRGDWEQWLLAREEWLQYNAERNSRATIKYVPVVEYDVAKYGEPTIPNDPDFVPYMGDQWMLKTLKL